MSTYINEFYLERESIWWIKMRVQWEKNYNNSFILVGELYVKTTLKKKRREYFICFFNH